MRRTQLDQAVWRTQAYAEVFQTHLTLTQLHRYLQSDRRFAWLEVARAAKATRTPLLKVTPSQRQQLRVKWQFVARAARVFALVPWIQSVWLTGSLAAGAARSEDDLDFLVITDPQRLWLSRLCVLFFSLILGTYRSRFFRRKSWGNAWCLNMWLESGALVLPPESRTLYEAREMIQARPIFVRTGVRAALFLERNAWIRQFVANGYFLAVERAHQFSWRRHASVSTGFSLWSFLNTWCYRFQHRVMSSALTRETVLPDRAFFHPRNTRSWIRKQYETICTRTGILPCFDAPDHP